MRARNSTWQWCLTLTACLVLQTLGAADWESADGFRQLALDTPSGSKPGFQVLPTAQTGIDFTNQLALRTSLTNQIYLNGSGVAAADVDGDDLCDLYFCGLETPNVLYRNQGNFRFTPTTSPAIACADQASTGAAFADIDGDGDPDLLVTGIRSGTRLFLNDGKGQFTEVTDPWGLRNRRGSTTLALADADGDGWLDLYVVNYRNETMRDEPDSPFDVRRRNGKLELVSYRGRPGTDPDLIGRFTFDNQSGVLENGEADQFFRNKGGRGFEPVPWATPTFQTESGVPMPPPYDWGLSASFRDLNGDSWPDLYVCNDFQSPDRIWINTGKGQFQPLDAKAIQQTSLFSMGVDVSDVNRDGRNDLFVVDMLSRVHADRQVQVMDKTAFGQYRASTAERPQSPRNTLLLQRANQDYAEVARLYNVAASYWSWCPVFLDVDLDGYEDLLITTGHGRDAQHADISRELDQEIQAQSLRPAAQLDRRRRYPELTPPNVAFRNQSGQGFEEAGPEWGFDAENISHGMALADLDNDGDHDVVVNCLNAPPLVLENQSPAARLRIELQGRSPNTSGIGATIQVEVPGLPPQQQEIVAGGRYLSSDHPSRVFATGPTAKTATIRVRWRQGHETTLENVRVNQLVRVIEPSPSPEPAPSAPPPPTPFFREVSEALIHQHADAPFDDETIQPLLPYQLSRSGPGVTWFDFNGDGWEDLFIGGGRGGKLGVYRNDQKGRFIRQRAQAFNAALRRDHATILAWQRTQTDRVLLIGSTNYEAARPLASAIREFSVSTGKERTDLLATTASIGPMAMADLDGDGDLDLFVGETHEAGRFPKPVSGHILRNQNGTLKQDPALAKQGQLSGNIQAAVWTRLGSERNPSLITANLWGPIRISRFEADGVAIQDKPLRWPESHSHRKENYLSELTGWWRSLAAGDFDGDGTMDLVAGNWGRNDGAAQSTRLASKRRIYYPDGIPRQFPLLTATQLPGESEWYPDRDWGSLGDRFPTIRNTYSSFTAFSKESVEVILPRVLPKTGLREAVFFESTVFLNRGDSFQVVPLPIATQYAPVTGISTGDFDADGNIDLVLNQNHYGPTDALGRQDAGGLLLLRGLGEGQFEVVPQPESGLQSHDEGRGLAVCDFNHDGRLDFISTAYNAPTRLYLNQSPHSGIRVHLQGRAPNFQAIGARVRAVGPKDELGPVQEIRLGGGYWSQNGPTLVVPRNDGTKAIQIQWPDGESEIVPVRPDQSQITRTQRR